MPARPVLPTELRRPLGLVAVFAGLTVIRLAATYRAGDQLASWDGKAMPLEGFEPPWRTFALVVDFLGEPVGVVLVLAAVCGAALLLRRPRVAKLSAGSTWPPAPPPPAGIGPYPASAGPAVAPDFNP